MSLKNPATAAIGPHTWRVWNQGVYLVQNEIKQMPEKLTISSPKSGGNLKRTQLFLVTSRVTRFTELLRAGKTPDLLLLQNQVNKDYFQPFQSGGVTKVMFVSIH